MIGFAVFQKWLRHWSSNYRVTSLNSRDQIQTSSFSFVLAKVLGHVSTVWSRTLDLTSSCKIYSTIHIYLVVSNSHPIVTPSSSSFFSSECTFFRWSMWFCIETEDASSYLFRCVSSEVKEKRIYYTLSLIISIFFFIIIIIFFLLNLFIYLVVLPLNEFGRI